MKRVLNIFSIIISIVIIILSLAFIFIEGRLLFSGDWLVYDNPVTGFLRYCSRLLLAIFALLKSLFEIIYLNKNEKRELLFFGDISLLLMSIIILIFATNYVGLVCFALAIVNILIGLIKYLNYKNN